VAFEGGVLFVEPKGPLSNIGFKTPEVTEFLRKSDGRVLSLAVVFTPILRIGCVVGRGVGVDVVLLFSLTEFFRNVMIGGGVVSVFLLMENNGVGVVGEIGVGSEGLRREDGDGVFEVSTENNDPGVLRGS